MLTGVPPQHNVDEYIDSKNNLFKTVVRAIKGRRSKTAKRIKHYRSSDELRIDAKDLVRELTHYDSRKRATARYAAGSPWILSDVSLSGQSKQDMSSKQGGPIVYLKCGTTSLDVYETTNASGDEDSV